MYHQLAVLGLVLLLTYLSQSSPYHLAVKLWRAIIYVFFREIKARGTYNIPKDNTPVIFVAGPHHNQFLDGLLLSSEVLRASNRKLSFLVAEKSMKRPFVGDMAKAMEAIAVKRAADDAKPGIGTIYMNSDQPSTQIYGIQTKFTTQLAPKMSISLSSSLGGAHAEVATVISDTELVLQKELNKEQSRKILLSAGDANVDHAIDYNVLPYIDQQNMYDSVYKRLEDGGCIGIFPEGGSHDKTDLLPLKAGVTIMALGAMSNNPNLQVKIVPVGLSYFHAHKFRSRAVIEFGTPREVSRDLVNLFNEGGSSKRKACSELLDTIYNGLKSVTVQAPDYETLMVIQAGRRLYSAPGQHPTLGQVVELNRRFISGYLEYKDEPKIKQLRNKVLKYNRRLQDLGIRDHQVDSATKSFWKAAGLLFYRMELLFVWGTLALPGALLHLPVFFTAKYISKKKAKEALAASTVKIKARDVVGTWKVLVSLTLLPMIYLFYIISATIITRKYGELLGLSNEVINWTPFWTLCVLPFLGISALKFGEVGMDVYKSLPPLFLTLLPGNENELERLKSKRIALSNELTDIIEEYGPKQIEHFEKKRVVSSHESQQKEASTTETNQTTMQWLDELLFGWSATKKADENSNPSSRDDESSTGEENYETVGEAGDFDAVASFVSLSEIITDHRSNKILA